MRSGENYFLNDSQLNTIFAVHSSQFASLPNELIFVVENGAVGLNQGEIRRLLRSGSTYSTEVLLSTALSGGSFAPSGLEHAMFAPINISGGTTPVVSVARTPGSPATIGEAGVNGSYRVSRISNTPQALAQQLVVRFKMRDILTTQALPGSDFQFVDPVNAPMSVTIAAGAAFVDLGIQPLADSLVEGTETAVLELLPSVTYTVSPAQPTATITLTDATVPTVPANLTFNLTPVNVTSGTGSDSYAFGVNSSGAVVGQYRDTFPYAANPWKGYYRSPQGVYSVPEQGFSGYQIWPYGVNDSGVMVGGRFVDASNPVSSLAFKWSTGNGMTWLNGIFGVANGQPLAYAINNNGIIVGQAKNAQGRLRAIFWNFGGITATDMESLAGADGLVDSTAFNLNSSSKVVGKSGISGSTAIHAFRSVGTIVPATDDLGTLGLLR